MALTVITGSNRGIGLELCRQLSEAGHEVLAACRSPSIELSLLGVEIAADVDVASHRGIEGLRSAVGERQVELLINNAGVLLWGDSVDSVDPESILQQFEVNALGPLRVVGALRSRLVDRARVIFITSRMGSIGDNSSGGAYGYRMSKAALNMAATCLAVELASANVSVGLFHPGMVRTDMTGGEGLLDPEESVRGLLARIGELTAATSGAFVHQNGQTLPW